MANVDLRKLHFNTVAHIYAADSLTKLAQEHRNDVTEASEQVLMQIFRMRSESVCQRFGVTAPHSFASATPSAMLQHSMLTTLGTASPTREHIENSMQQLNGDEHRHAMSTGKRLARAAHTQPYSVDVESGELRLNLHGIVNNANTLLHEKHIAWGTAVQVQLAHAALGQGVSDHLSNLTASATESVTDEAERVTLTAAALREKRVSLKEAQKVLGERLREQQRAAFQHDVVRAIVDEHSLHNATPHEAETLRAHFCENPPLGEALTPLHKQGMSHLAQNLTQHLGSQQVLPAITNNTPFTSDEAEAAHRHGVKLAGDWFKARVRRSPSPFLP